VNSLKCFAALASPSLSSLEHEETWKLWYFDIAVDSKNNILKCDNDIDSQSNDEMSELSGIVKMACSW